MPIRPSSPAFRITSIGKRFSRSISSAIGRTSPSAKSRARRWISRCSSVSSNIGRGSLPAARPAPASVLLRELLRARQAVEQLLVERRPVVRRRTRLGGGGQLRRGHLARLRGVAGALLLQFGARLVELALARGEQMAEVFLHRVGLTVVVAVAG